MVYTLVDREQLPTINEVLKMVKNMTSQMPIRHRMPYDEPVEGDDWYLLNRTANGLFTLKPNITMQSCLYFGDNDYHPMLQPAWNQFKTRDEFMVQNVLREELEVVMLSHPLYRLFLEGIPTRKLRVKIINPFGNAMAYGFPSPMIPLTASIETAAFFSTHRRDEATGVWRVIPERNERGEVNVGVLYAMELVLPFPMMMGLSCIGMQAFERPGRQRLYGLNIGTESNFNEHRFVYGFQFRQAPSEVSQLDKQYKQGELLTPQELLADKAQAILTTRMVSEDAFELNCKNNPRDVPAENRQKLEEAGVTIVKESLHKFTEDELTTEFYPTARERWDNMFGQVAAVHPGFDRLLDDIRNFPNTSEGQKFFRL